jgi:hypothetical protein
LIPAFIQLAAIQVSGKVSGAKAYRLKERSRIVKLLEVTMKAGEHGKI